MDGGDRGWFSRVSAGEPGGVSVAAGLETPLSCESVGKGGADRRVSWVPLMMLNSSDPLNLREMHC